MDPVARFRSEVEQNIDRIAEDHELKRLTLEWIEKANRHRYTYNFSHLGRPLIQFPQDIIAMQELIWRVKPDLIIETGIAHGGSLIMSASMLAMLDYCEAVTRGEALDPQATQRRVLGIDIEIRPHNKSAIEAHPMSHRIDMIQGSSIDPEVIARVRERAGNYDRVLVCLDSNHTHEHVLAELEAYAPLTSKGSYCVVFDTLVEDMPEESFPDRPWGRGDSPKTAVREYLRRLKSEGRRGADGGKLAFEVDRRVEEKLVITVAPEGYLKRVAEACSVS